MPTDHALETLTVACASFKFTGTHTLSMSVKQKKNVILVPHNDHFPR